MTSREKGISRQFIQELEGMSYEIAGQIMEGDDSKESRIMLSEQLREFLRMADIRAGEDVISLLFHKHATGEQIISRFVNFCVDSRKGDTSTPFAVDMHFNLHPLH